MRKKRFSLKNANHYLVIGVAGIVITTIVNCIMYAITGIFEWIYYVIWAVFLIAGLVKR